jgi:hypothetical protein
MSGACPSTYHFCFEKGMEDLLRDNSSFPLWILGADSFVHLNDSVQAGATKNIKASTLSFKSNWQYCEHCVASDRKKFGTSYWHLEHNLPGISHCIKHQCPLHQIDKVKSLADLKMPHRIRDRNEQPYHGDSEILMEWSLFVYQLYLQLNTDSSAAERLKAEIMNYLKIPDLRPSDKRPYYSELLLKMERELSPELLSHCFMFYRNKDYVKKPNILLTTIGNNQLEVRHPVYWLVIAFWLKEHLPSLNAGTAHVSKALCH